MTRTNLQIDYLLVVKKDKSYEPMTMDGCCVWHK